MDIKQQILIAGICAMGFILWTNWNTFQEKKLNPQTTQTNLNQPVAANSNSDSFVPSAEPTLPTIGNVDVNQQVEQQLNTNDFVTVETDLFTAKINPNGGSIESLVLKQEAEKAENPDKGFELLKNSSTEIFVSQSGLIGTQGDFPDHLSKYNIQQTDYSLSEDSNEIRVPLFWTSSQGVSITKTFIFKKDSYVIDVEFSVKNSLAKTWQGYMYGQFKRTQPLDAKKGSLLQLPSYMGGIQYTPEDKYQKVSFDDISDETLKIDTTSGWIGMLQHYFVGVWMPQETAENYNFYSSYKNKSVQPEYTMGFKSLTPLTVTSGQQGKVSASMFVGPKEQKRLKAIQKENGVEGLPLTVDYGWLTVISDPLYWLLKTIYSLVQNWGWSIIILTFLIKLAFFPLSAASYKSMARMKKLQPRMETLKERFGDDRAALQQQMMKLYKEEKVNPAGGCLPILIQIPVFTALYFVLLESVELRHAPFALWIQDLSSKDPYYILPILMGLSMLLQFRLNPTPMEPMQQKIMMIMPIAMTFLFVTFPSGLVLYWVVNNVLSIAQQWTINKTIIKNQT